MLLLNWQLAATDNILKDYLQSIGKRVHDFRKEKKYSLEELGLRIGLDRSAVRRIELGEVNITARTILKLAIALEKGTHEFLYFSFDHKSVDLSGLNKAERSIKSPTKKKPVKKAKGR